jgi:hypothetical protein
MALLLSGPGISPENRDTARVQMRDFYRMIQWSMENKWEVYDDMIVAHPGLHWMVWGANQAGKGAELLEAIREFSKPKTIGGRLVMKNGILVYRAGPGRGLDVQKSQELHQKAGCTHGYAGIQAGRPIDFQQYPNTGCTEIQCDLHNPTPLFLDQCDVGRIQRGGNAQFFVRDHQLFLVNTIGDGGCAFRAVDPDRSRAHARQQLSRRVLCEMMRTLVIGNNKSAVNALNEEYTFFAIIVDDEAKQALRRQFGTINNQALSPEQKKALAVVQTYQNERMYLPVGSKIFEVIAGIIGCNLVIFNSTGVNGHLGSVFAECVIDPSYETLFIAYNGENHFERAGVLPQPQPN